MPIEEVQLTFARHPLWRKVMGPAADADGDGLPDDPDADASGLAGDAGAGAPRRPAGGCGTVSVAALKPGDAVLVLRAPAARHTGVEVDERIEER